MKYADLEVWCGIVLAAVCALLAMRHRPARSAVPRVTLLGAGAASVLFAAHAAVVDAVADPDGLSAADHPVL